VWVTNRGRVEHWSRRGKIGQVIMKKPCGAMAISAGSLWVADCVEAALVRIDLKSARVAATIRTGIAHLDGELNVVAGAGSIWVASDVKGIVARVDPATNAVIASVEVSPDTSYLAFGFDAVWAVSNAKRTVQKIDPQTNRVVKTTMLGQQPGFLAAGEGAVWVQEQLDGTLARVDPATGEVTGRVKVDETLKYGDIDTGGGKVWLRTTAGQTFVVIDPKTLAVRERVGKPVGSGALRYTPRGVWTSAHDVQTISWWANPRMIGR
jgi:virginiamycin B lyase